MMTTPILKYFKFSHLPPELRAVSELCADLALRMDAELPDCAEKSAGLRKLLEAKDCFVRAALEPRPITGESLRAPMEERARKQAEATRAFLGGEGRRLGLAGDVDLDAALIEEDARREVPVRVGKKLWLGESDPLGSTPTVAVDDVDAAHLNELEREEHRVQERAYDPMGK